MKALVLYIFLFSKMLKMQLVKANFIEILKVAGISSNVILLYKETFHKLFQDYTIIRYIYWPAKERLQSKLFIVL